MRGKLNDRFNTNSCRAYSIINHRGYTMKELLICLGIVTAVYALMLATVYVIVLINTFIGKDL